MNTHVADYTWLKNLLEPIDLMPGALIWARAVDRDAVAVRFPDGWPQAEDLPLDPATGEWRSAVHGIWRGDVKSARLVQTMGVQGTPRKFRSEADGVDVFDSGAVLYESLEAAPDGAVLGAHVPLGLLRDGLHRGFRAWLSTAFEVQWIVYLGSTVAEAMGVHPSFQSAFLVVRKVAGTRETPDVVRIARLSAVGTDQWAAILKHARRQHGGESENVIVLRRPIGEDPAWVFDGFSKKTQKVHTEVEQVGGLRLLGDVALITRGLHRATTQAIEPEEDRQRLPASIPWRSGRDIGSGGRLAPPSRRVLRDGVTGQAALAPGDILLRGIADRRTDVAHGLACLITEDDVPAAFDTTCLRIRLKEGAPRQVSELLCLYLNSEAARAGLRGLGVENDITIDQLQRLRVPWPSPDVLGALEELVTVEGQYLAWARSVHEARGQLFAEGDIGRAVKGLLARRQVELERIQAAEASQTLAFRVQNQFPHPIALRHERIVWLGHGKERLDETLECAEILVILLGIMALIQQAGGRRLTESIPGTQLPGFAKPGELKFDWGKLFEVLREGTSYSRKHAEPLGLPFPALYELGEMMQVESSPWSVAERSLRDARNDASHLQRLIPSELVARSRQAELELASMLEAAKGLALVPLVRVISCSRDPITGERTAEYELLVGSSVVHRRIRRYVEAELSSNDVGFLDQRGRFHSALPWVSFDECSKCKRTEVFVFSRLEKGKCTYIAMETGHQSEKPALGLCVEQLVGVYAAGRDGKA